MIETPVKTGSNFVAATQQAPLTRGLIMSALDEASAQINTRLGYKDIRLEVVGTKGDDVLAHLEQQWQIKRYYWGKMLPRAHEAMSTNGDTDRINTFVVALYKGNKLCGLCRSDERGTALNVDTIEGLQDEGKNPLIGFTIPSLSQALLSIAQKANITSLIVALPDTIHSNAYSRTGYVENDGKFQMPVSEVSEINWAAVINRQLEKNTDVANANSPISESLPAKQRMPA